LGHIFSSDADGPRDAIDHRAVHSWTPSVINRRRSSADVESSRPRPPSSLCVTNSMQTTVVCLYRA